MEHSSAIHRIHPHPHWQSAPATFVDRATPPSSRRSKRHSEHSTRHHGRQRLRRAKHSSTKRSQFQQKQNSNSNMGIGGGAGCWRPTPATGSSTRHTNFQDLYSSNGIQRSICNNQAQRPWYRAVLPSAPCILDQTTGTTINTRQPDNQLDQSDCYTSTQKWRHSVVHKHRSRGLTA